MDTEPLCTDSAPAGICGAAASALQGQLLSPCSVRTSLILVGGSSPFPCPIGLTPSEAQPPLAASVEFE